MPFVINCDKCNKTIKATDKWEDCRDAYQKEEKICGTCQKQAADLVEWVNLNKEKWNRKIETIWNAAMKEVKEHIEEQGKKPAPSPAPKAKGAAARQ